MYPAAPRHAPASGWMRPVSIPSRLDFPVAVAPDDPDPVALVEPERDTLEHDPRRVLEPQPPPPPAQARHIPHPPATAATQVDTRFDPIYGS